MAAAGTDSGSPATRYHSQQHRNNIKSSVFLQPAVCHPQVDCRQQWASDGLVDILMSPYHHGDGVDMTSTRSSTCGWKGLGKMFLFSVLACFFLFLFSKQSYISNLVQKLQKKSCDVDNMVRNEKKNVFEVIWISNKICCFSVMNLLSEK